MATPLEVFGVHGLPEVVAGDDIAELIAAAVELRDGDVVVVTSKIVSKAEGRLAQGTRDDHLSAETVRIVARRGDTSIVETHHGFVLAAAGIDASNVPTDMVTLLPVDPDGSAQRIRFGLQRIAAVDVAVIISDTMGRPWRNGVVDTAIGAAGLDVLWDLRGQRDPAGHLLEATVIAIADELAAAADLVKGKLAATPVAVIRGFGFNPTTSDDAGARPLIRTAADDLFRLGTREAMRQVVIDSAPVPDAHAANTEKRIDEATVSRAVGLVGSSSVVLAVSDGGRVITATGDPLDVGVVLGRVLAALAAEGLRGSEPTPTSNGATLTVTVM